MEPALLAASHLGLALGLDGADAGS